IEQFKILLEDREIPKQWYNIVADLPTPMKPPLHPGTGQPVTPDDLAAIFPMNIMEQVKILLEDREIPKQWYKIVAELPTPMNPPLHPGTGQPVTPDDLAAIFPMNIIEQEASAQRWIDIPDEVLQKYLLWRPSPLYRAYNFEKLLNCPVKIYYKNEGVSPAGSHKPNAAIPMAYYNKVAGTKRIVTETGAGQWGSALSMATQMFGLGCRVYMVKISYEQKPYRRLMMNTWGAECIPSPR